MKIIDKTKDYYDFAVTDNVPNIYWERYQNLPKFITISKSDFKDSGIMDAYYFFRDKYDKIQDCFIAIICGELYVTCKANSNWTRIIDFRTDFEKMLSRQHCVAPNAKQILTRINKLADSPIVVLNKYPNAHVHVHEFDKATLYLADPRYYNVYLKDAGIPKYLNAQQLYQEIEYWLINVLKDSPDVQPHINMTDKEKIVSHGFDLKQSFRHRK